MPTPRKPKLLDGVKLAEKIKAELKQKVLELKEKGIMPGLAVVLVGDNPASQIYVRNKRKTCEELGIQSFAYDLPKETTETELLELIDKLNRDNAVHGILIQSPVPKHIDEEKILNAVDPNKDVDGFHPVNKGKLLNGQDCFVACTPAGIQELLLRYGYNIQGRHVVIVGRSNIVGKPLAALLVQKSVGADATVTICHSRTRNLAQITKTADIIVAAMGVPEFIQGRMVRDGCVVIDVGMNRIPDNTKKSGYRLIGDVHFPSVSKKARAITPVPGGVGPMTIAMLMKNTVKSAEKTLHHTS
ncbi:MAG TPA: bifunctional methylenetetrahydrofolate dehydrogenase/methenyltetrahydrofolate cyclohydrolase FolD [Candidatus Hydrogenedens sp.]|nr:bifunctional methylenetetrahydrofolate dehydrogenase/methenyltetrahydrofolate cyclohydrolase FolD [Candidatus Hydrogenedens sp.]HPP58811.1 bifunctional methylenetetrahydrofolate dehydrogenase/methenyltetrahydrofolate cyclohydrolase FolD [Candidatus Hydrogenedens sp.]